jgi:hypothetical protein
VFHLVWEHKRKLRERLSEWFEGTLERALRRTIDGTLYRADREKFWS